MRRRRGAGVLIKSGDPLNYSSIFEAVILSEGGVPHVFGVPNLRVAVRGMSRDTESKDLGFLSLIEITLNDHINSGTQTDPRIPNTLVCSLRDYKQENCGDPR